MAAPSHAVGSRPIARHSWPRDGAALPGRPASPNCLSNMPERSSAGCVIGASQAHGRVNMFVTSEGGSYDLPKQYEAAEWSVDLQNRLVRHRSGAEVAFYRYVNEYEWLQTDD